jgi:PAS domain S-box-containing protein
MDLMPPNNLALQESTTDNTIPPPAERFDQIISEVEDYAILVLDRTGNVRSWNRGAQRIKGYLPTEIIGSSFRLFYPKEDIENGLPERLLEEAKTTGKANHEGWRIRKDGHRFWGSVTITAIHDNVGHVNGFVKITRDLTEKKIAEDRYSNMLEELRLKNEELKREEDRYHKMVSEVEDYAIILLDTDGTIRDWNKGAERVKGYTADEIVGKSFRLFYTPEDKIADLPTRLLGEAVRNGSTTHEGYRVRKDGMRFWGSVVITALHANDGKVIGFSKVTKDLTERKAAEERLSIFTQQLQQVNEHLRQSEERYHRMINEVQDYAILLLNTNGEIQNWNAGAQLIKGYDAAEILGKHFRHFYLPEDIERRLPERLLKEARDTGKATSEGWRKRKDGSKFWASVVITALHDSTGQIIGFSKVTRDLTERKKTEDALKQNALDLELKNHELETLNGELSSFAYVVSHDFREPIRKIQVFAARQLEAAKSIEEIQSFSKKIIDSAERMHSLMESLLKYSRISNDHPQRELVDLNDTLTAVKGDLELLISESGAMIETVTLPSVFGISFQLHQLFLNLIANSIKFAHQERKPIIKLTVNAVQTQDLPEDLVIKSLTYYRLTFSDNGIGFDSSQKEKIFDVFKQIGPRDRKGTGIGLAIVKKVAHNHDGDVEAEGIPGKGARFHVYLPNS